MKRCIWIVPVAALVLKPAVAHAEEPASEHHGHSGVEAFLITGDEEHNPGDPGPAKLATIVSLYSLSAASLATGAVFGLQALSAKSDADDFREAQARDFCSNPNDDACVHYEDMRADQNAMGRSAGLFLGLGALLFLGGATAAQLWANDAPAMVAISPIVSPEQLGLTLRSAL